jgi:hypothetical protein
MQGHAAEAGHDNGVAVLRLDASKWISNRADLLEIDNEFHALEDTGHDFELWLCGECADLKLAFQVMTRYQRLLPLESRDYPEWFSEVLAMHRRLFDVSKPLVRADYDHSLDTWRWVRRLYPEASPVLQGAALFHDIERLESEADNRIEHLAADYVQFKRDHAKGSARILERVLGKVSIPTTAAMRLLELVIKHESPADDEELLLLNDADALSFFSLNSWGFVRYFDVAHVQRKVQFTLARMRPSARRLLDTLRLPSAVQRCVGSDGIRVAAASSTGADTSVHAGQSDGALPDP